LKKPFDSLRRIFNRQDTVEASVRGEEGKKNRRLMYPLCALFAFVVDFCFLRG
jgi:hypothetical protein